MTIRTQDSTLAYFVNQLDNFDQRLHEPLFSVTWGRDIKLRTGISMANESTSFTRSSFAGAGTQNATGKPWLSANSSTIAGVDVNGEPELGPVDLGRSGSCRLVVFRVARQGGLVAALQQGERLRGVREDPERLGPPLLQRQVGKPVLEQPRHSRRRDVEAARVEHELHTLETGIHALAGGSFNIGSPKQLAEVLFETLKLPVLKRRSRTTSPSTAPTSGAPIRRPPHLA